MHTAPVSPRRRSLLGAAAGSAFIAACGGGGDGGPGGSGTPEIIDFSADRTGYFVGEQALLQVRFRGASARIEPDIGPVVDGAVVATAPLAARRRLQLVVESPGLPAARRELWLDVRYRDRWLPLADFVSSCHASVDVGDGRVIVTGGSRGLSTLSDAVDRFDPATRRFERIGTLASGRSNHGAVALGNGRVLVVGGAVSATGAPSAELIDVDSGAVQPTGALQQPRVRHATTRLGDGRVLVTGGLGRNTAEVWEPASGRWRLLASRLAHDREHHSATELADGRVLIAGGLSNAAGAAGYVFAELFDPRTDSFTPLPGGGSERRSLHAAHLLSDHSLLLLGGEVVEDTIRPLDSVLRFDPADNSFRPQPALATARTLSSSLRLPGDELVFFGGQTADALASTSCAAWQAGTQRALAPLPDHRLWHTAHLLPDGRVLVIGGDDGAGAYALPALLYE